MTINSEELPITLAISFPNSLDRLSCCLSVRYLQRILTAQSPKESPFFHPMKKILKSFHLDEKPNIQFASYGLSRLSIPKPSSDRKSKSDSVCLPLQNAKSFN